MAQDSMYTARDRIPILIWKEASLTLYYALRTWRLLLALLAPLTIACTQTIVGNAGTDAGTSPSSRADAGEPDAMPDAGPQALTLRATADNAVLQGNSAACFHQDSQRTRDNSYYRTYPLATMGVNSDFEVSSVEFGIQEAEGASGNQPAQISLYTLTGSFLLANLTLVASTSVVIDNQLLTVLDVPISATIPAGSTLVVMLSTPDGVDTNNTFFIGSNQAAETSPSFLTSGECNVPEPTPTADLGVSGLVMSIVLNVKGTHTP